MQFKLKEKCSDFLNGKNGTQTSFWEGKVKCGTIQLKPIMCRTTSSAQVVPH